MVNLHGQMIYYTFSLYVFVAFIVLDGGVVEMCLLGRVGGVARRGVWGGVPMESLSSSLVFGGDSVAAAAVVVVEDVGCNGR